MPKMKRHKGIAKRFKVSANGKVKYKKGGETHTVRSTRNLSVHTAR